MNWLQQHGGSGDNVGGDKIENLNRINSLKLDGNNNVVIQGADKSHIEIPVSVPFNEFALKFTQETYREIDGLYQRVQELRQAGDVKENEIRTLSAKVT